MKKIILFNILAWFSYTIGAQFFFENPVTWSFSSVDKGNGSHEIYFRGSIEKPWYVYAIKTENDGPIPTSVEFEDPQGYTAEGNLVEITKAVRKFDPGFGFEVGMYSGRIELMHRIKVRSSSEIKVKAYIEYQCCNDETCLPPYQQEFSLNLPGTFSAAKANTGAEEIIKKSMPEENARTEVFIQPDLDSEAEDSDYEDSLISGETISGRYIYDGQPPLKEKDSLLIFLLIAFLAGLAAILTPCVFPMIPMTVTFFMRGSSNRGVAIIKGLVFGISMIMVYTGLGVVVGLTGTGASAGSAISTHWIPNIIFFMLFLVFAASFFGMFEIIIPSGLINKTDKQADKGGITGAFFMGITTVLVSFSCTGPIVGSLLIESAGGFALKPILGMFFFSLAFALPFTLLAIFPSMLKNLPTSGGWLNSIKVVLAFIILAFSMKFLSAIDQSYHLNIFSREIYLAIWLVLSLLLGLYFLGRIKFAHDNDIPYLSFPRLILAILAFTFSIYLFTGIMGADLRSISSLIPPKSASYFSFPESRIGVSSSENDQKLSFCGPGKYDELFKLPHGIKGYFYYNDGLACAIEKNKPVFLDFTGHSCSNCKQMENMVWSDPEVLKILKEDYVVISLYTDDKTRVSPEDVIIRPDGKELKTIGDINKQLEIDRFQTIATPLYVLLDHDGNLLNQPKGKDLNVSNFIDFLQEGKRIFN